MNKNSLFLFFITIFTISNIYAQESSIQFPHLDFHMKMNQELKTSISYNAEANIIVGDKSGLILSLGIAGEDVSIQSSLDELIKLDALKLAIAPSSSFAFNAFYGRYKYLGEDPVIPRGFQINFVPGVDPYGYKTIDGAGIGFTFPVLEGRYEPEIIVYSDSFNGIDYLNIDALMTFRFEKWFLELYTGIAIPSLDTDAISEDATSIKGRFGFSVYSVLDHVNVYFATYIPAHFKESLKFDDIYIKLSQYLLIGGFEQTFTFVSLGAESGNPVDPIVGVDSTPDMNIYLSLGGRINNVGFGVDYGFIYGLYQQDLTIGNIQEINNRIGTYVDLQFLGLTYKLGVFYTLPGSNAYIKDVARPGELGMYVSIYGRA